MSKLQKAVFNRELLQVAAFYFEFLKIFLDISSSLKILVNFLCPHHCNLFIYLVIIASVFESGVVGTLIFGVTVTEENQ